MISKGSKKSQLELGICWENGANYDKCVNMLFSTKINNILQGIHFSHFLNKINKNHYFEIQGKN